MAAVSARLRDLIARGRDLVALTGAGISAESGVPTFRGRDGLWEGVRPEEVATPGAFRRHPRRVWEFYEARRRRVASCAPNAGHLALAGYQTRHPGALTLVTQNVDGLHRRAGGEDVLEIHGSLFRLRCTAEGTVREDLRVPLPELPPRCDCGALLRPDVVWFGELLPEAIMARAVEASRAAAVFLVIGTSALVYPAAALPEIALESGAYLVEINIEATPLSARADEVLRGPAAALLPDLLTGAAPAVGTTGARREPGEGGP